MAAAQLLRTVRIPSAATESAPTVRSRFFPPWLFDYSTRPVVSACRCQRYHDQSPTAVRPESPLSTELSCVRAKLGRTHLGAKNCSFTPFSPLRRCKTANEAVTAKSGHVKRVFLLLACNERRVHNAGCEPVLAVTHQSASCLRLFSCQLTMALGEAVDDKCHGIPNRLQDSGNQTSRYRCDATDRVVSRLLGGLFSLLIARGMC